MARQNSALRSEITVAKARHSLVSAANESSHSSGVVAGKIRRLERPLSFALHYWTRIP